MRPPRLREETREQLRKRVVDAGSTEDADRVIDRLWSILEGDMQERITTLIYAARATVESKGDRLGGLEGALDNLAGREVAATTTKQIKEGDCNFDRKAR